MAFLDGTGLSTLVSHIQAITGKKKLTELNTTEKGSLVGAINELNSNFDKIGTTLKNSTFETDLGSGSWSGAASITLSPGTWIVNAWSWFEQNNNGYRAVSIGTTSTATEYGRSIFPPASGNATAIEHNKIITVSSNTIICVYLLQTTGSTLKVNSSIEAVRIK